MADVEIRAFGWRFLALLERRKPERTEPPQPTQGHSGIFEVNSSTYYDDKAVDLHFGYTPHG